MSDNTDERLERLFAAARSARPDTSGLEEHFETRLMARIRERRAEPVPWYGLAWRMMPAFAVILAVIAVCTVSFNPARLQDPFAAITSGQEEQLAKSYLTGE